MKFFYSVFLCILSAVAFSEAIFIKKFINERQNVVKMMTTTEPSTTPPTTTPPTTTPPTTTPPTTTPPTTTPVSPNQFQQDCMALWNAALYQHLHPSSYYGSPLYYPYLGAHYDPVLLQPISQYGRLGPKMNYHGPQ
ncbi:Hypothetical predicted protein [Cloeon dipterum]|uniref:Uncharacterized protein n=1 Tax=Cloeon dipterum TaxID=197152 RepID=A0A8S1CAM8_9INSE|nr:Hypothetical predicted protein [Cloeon dipterum]